LENVHLEDREGDRRIPSHMDFRGIRYENGRWNELTEVVSSDGLWTFGFRYHCDNSFMWLWDGKSDNYPAGVQLISFFVCSGSSV